MKKNLLLLFCFISLFGFSQKYHFDYFIKKQSNLDEPDKQQWIDDSFYDSVHHQSLLITTQNNKTIAIIYETETDRRHVFTVNKLKNTFTFDYKYSNQFPKPDKSVHYNKENVIRVEKTDPLTFNITVFKNSKLKRKKISAMVTLERSELNYINLNADYNRTDEINEKLKSFLEPDSNYIIKNEQIKYHSSGYTFNKSIQNIQKTDLTIVVPEQVILKEYDYGHDFND